MKVKNRLLVVMTIAVLAAITVSTAFAAHSGAMKFNVYDNTQGGLAVNAVGHPDIGNVEVIQPDGGTALIININVKRAVPDCTLDVELVRLNNVATNGGVWPGGHAGGITVIGTLTTKKQGNGHVNIHFDPGDGVPDTLMRGHIDLENNACGLATNQYGAAPDPQPVPANNTPMHWME